MARGCGCPVKITVFHFAAAQRFDALFADHPTDRIGNVRFTATIRPTTAVIPSSSKTTSVGSENDLNPWIKSFSNLSIVNSYVVDVLLICKSVCLAFKAAEYKAG
jgi:hypothetical protein